LIAALKQKSLLRIHDDCFSRRDTKFLAIEQVNIMNESAVANATVDNIVIELEDFQLPTISWYLGNHIRSCFSHGLTHRESGSAGRKQSREATSACPHLGSGRCMNGSHDLGRLACRPGNKV